MPPIHPWRLILASASPRRRELLKGLDLPVEITKVDVDETPPPGMDDREVAEHLAVKKANAWPGTLAPDQALITADTTVLVDGHLLNKPEDAADAARMLGLLSGRMHRVHTGVCLKTMDRQVAFTDMAEVHFGRLHPEEIAFYVHRYRPFDKAGSYGVQEWIGYVAVERIVGSFYTVMGLPLHRVYQELRKLPPP